MKLYVWVDPYNVSYGSSMCFAVARNLNSAKAQARKGEAYRYGEFPNEHNVRVDLGEPTRVVDLPCAEWHEWQE